MDNCADCLDMKPGELKNHAHGSCPDCMTRDALGVMGRVKRNKRTGGSRAAFCETCKGTGAIPLYGKDRMDPYARKGWVVAG